MNFNTFLFRFGLNPENFKDTIVEPIKTEHGFLYEIEQRTDLRTCPFCHNDNTYIKDYDYVEINSSETNHIKDILRIKKVRFYCKECAKSFTPTLKGLSPYSKITKQTRNFIRNDFLEKLTFKQIGLRYNISKARVIQIFDEDFKNVPRLKMPSVLCIDEIHFTEEYDQKYCCILYDFNSGEIVDIVRNRQLEYLKEYFSNIPEKERQNVTFFISDMYDGYATVQRLFFKNSVHIIDIFHVVTQLTKVINTLRVRTMNLYSKKGSIEYNFMKSHWKEFLCKSSRISNKMYTSKLTGESYYYEELVQKCVKLNPNLLKGYNCLQDTLKYSNFFTYSEALRFIEFISNRLLLSEEELLISVGQTYLRWKHQIAQAFSKIDNGRHYTNAIAESLNNHLKTILKISYGCHNFERFRKRALLISTYSKPK